MGEEDFADFVAAIEEEERNRSTQYTMEMPRDTIYYIKPFFSKEVTFEFSFKPKYKRVCKI